MFSEKLREKIERGKIWKFFGGVKLPVIKPTAKDAIEELRLPSLITLPVERHLGEGGTILVTAGEYVKKYQQLTTPGGGRLVPLHASTSGTVMSIGDQILPHPSMYQGQCITIKPDGLDAAVDVKPLENWEELEPSALLDRIREMGIEGLGGALFQTASKLKSAADKESGCNLFIVNGCECEPEVSCDDRLMQESADGIALGIRIIRHILKPRQTIVAIEEDKSAAIEAMRKACKDIAQVRVLPAKYPSGSARTLIRILTGKEIPYSAHTSECGIVVDNVSTVFAVKQADRDGIPLVSRVVTDTGRSLATNGNYRVRMGTSARFVLNHCKLKPEFRQRIIMGGPMMGFTLPGIDVPITKSVNCILAPGAAEIPPVPEEGSCIRCGRCARVCPSRLVPYQMYQVSRASAHGAARKKGIADCTLCGCCTFICPSKLNLTGQFRREQAIQALIDESESRNTLARERIAEHEKREAERKAKLEAKKKAALERIKAKGKAVPQKDGAAAPAEGPSNQASAPSDRELRRQQIYAEARARAQAAASDEKTAETAPQSFNPDGSALSEVPRSAALPEAAPENEAVFQSAAEPAAAPAENVT